MTAIINSLRNTEVSILAGQELGQDVWRQSLMFSLVLWKEIK